MCVRARASLFAAASFCCCHACALYIRVREHMASDRDVVLALAVVLVCVRVAGPDQAESKKNKIIRSQAVNLIAKVDDGSS